MYDAASPFDFLPLQRARGELRVGLRVRDGKTALSDFRQVGCLKARFPRPEEAGWMSVATMNISGGVAAGDQLDLDFHFSSGARASISAQAAERFYRALPDSEPARVRTTITVEESAAAEWLPQETILFDRCALDRVLTVNLAEDAWFLGVESLVFGRAAMGERVQRGEISDTIRVRRGGRLVLHDAIRLSGAVEGTLARPAVARGANAVATIFYVAPNAPARLEELRHALANAPAECGASAWDGMLVARILAESSAALRTAVIAGLEILRDGRPLPRMWCC